MHLEFNFIKMLYSLILTEETHLEGCDIPTGLLFVLKPRAKVNLVAVRTRRHSILQDQALKLNAHFTKHHECLYTSPTYPFKTKASHGFQEKNSAFSTTKSFTRIGPFSKAGRGQVTWGFYKTEKKRVKKKSFKE